MVEQLVGTWDLESSEKWEEYMKEIGVSYILRKAALTLKPTTIISNNGKHWTLKIKSTFKNSEFEATEDQEFDESRIYGYFKPEHLSIKKHIFFNSNL